MSPEDSSALAYAEWFAGGGRSGSPSSMDLKDWLPVGAGLLQGVVRTGRNNPELVDLDS